MDLVVNHESVRRIQRVAPQGIRPLRPESNCRDGAHAGGCNQYVRVLSFHCSSFSSHDDTHEVLQALLGGQTGAPRVNTVPRMWPVAQRPKSPGTRERFSISKPLDSRTPVLAIVMRQLRAYPSGNSSQHLTTVIAGSSWKIVSRSWFRFETNPERSMRRKRRQSQYLRACVWTVTHNAKGMPVGSMQSSVGGPPCFSKMVATVSSSSRGIP